MQLIASFCNKTPDSPSRDVFLAIIDTASKVATPIGLLNCATEGSPGITGFARCPGGYVALSSKSTGQMIVDNGLDPGSLFGACGIGVIHLRTGAVVEMEFAVAAD